MMIHLAWFVFSVTMMQLLIAFANIIFRSKLPEGHSGDNPLISVLIPARNEEKNIGNILNDLKSQDYSNIEVIVFNDQSGDKTFEIAQDFARTDRRISVINSLYLPAGWLGKNWACHSLAKSARGEYLLFLDADVRIGKGLLRNAFSYMQLLRLSLISIFPKQILKTIGEKITVPNMNYILLSLLPLVLVRRTGASSVAAANGQFMFFDSGAYREVDPHEKMKNDKVEDIEIARLLKKLKYPVACMVGDNSIQCRMYDGFKESVNGFSKNVTAFFGNSIILALIFWLLTTFGVIIIMMELPSIILLSYLAAYLITRVIISFVSEQSIRDNLLFLIPQQISCGLFIFNSFINKNIRTYRWKGREIQ